MDGFDVRAKLQLLFVFLTVVTLSSSFAAAQTIDDGGMWTALFAQGDIPSERIGDGNWKWWFDGHYRMFEDNDGYGQSIVRPGLGYGVGENSALWAGYGWIRTSPITGNDFDEHRIWQQWTWSKSLAPFKVAARTRFEQRLLETGDDTGLRLRQFIRGQKSLGKCSPFTFVVWDEIFVALNDTDWGARSGFDQNRVFVGFGVKQYPWSNLRTEIGYMNQTVNVNGPANRSNHILAVNIFRSPRR